MGHIRHAWCVELGDVLTAHDAKREFFAMEPRPAKLNFLCADERCRAARAGGTRVTCVNYQKLPSEAEQSMIVHYRLLDEHQPWCTASAADVEEESHPALEENEKKTRLPKAKKNDLFQIFDPGAGTSIANRPTSTATAINGKVSEHKEQSTSGSSAAKPNNGTNSTRFVEDLAALHVQAQKDPLIQAILQEKITVRGVGTGRLADLFRPLEKGWIGGHNYIWYGGATIKPYGKGFLLKFYSKIDDHKVSTYVSSEQMKGYRYRASLEELIRCANNHRYVKAYIWGRITPSDMEGQASLIPERLQHLAIILGPKL